MKRYSILFRRAAAVLLAVMLLFSALPASADETLTEEMNRISAEMLALMAKDKTFEYKGESYPVIEGIQVANDIFWQTDDYYPFCDAVLAANLDYSAEMGALFLKYVDVLNRIAVAEGYANYKEYADKVLYRYNFDTSAVFDIIRENYPRSIPLIINLVQYEDYSNDDLPLSQEGYIQGVIARYGELSPSFAPPLEELVRSDRFTISKMDRDFLYGSVMKSSKEIRMDIGYTTDSNFAETLTHEMGHYIHEIQMKQGSENYAIIETHSKGGVLLCSDFAETRFTETVGADWAALYMMQYISMEMSTIYEGAVKYALFSDIFVHPENYKPETIGEKHLEYMLALGHTGGYSPQYQMLVGCEWCKDHMVCETPLYSLAYCLAACNALKLWYDEEKYGTGAETYVRLINTYASPEEPYSDFCKRMGLLDFFAPNAHEGLDDFLADKLTKYYSAAFGE